MRQLRLSLLRSLWAAFALSTMAGAPYLPLVGPPPLRFAAPPDLTKKLISLPPIALTNPVSHLSMPKPIAQTQTNAAPIAMTLPAPAPTAVPGTNAPPANLDIGGGQADLIAPQMLLRYFSRGTNTSSTVVAPVGFTPPSGSPGASSASYSTSP